VNEILPGTEESNPGEKVIRGKNVIAPRCCYPNGDGFRENSEHIATDY